jgi:hypothetical protein
MKRGAVTERDQADLETVALLNTLLATELGLATRSQSIPGRD